MVNLTREPKQHSWALIFLLFFAAASAKYADAATTSVQYTYDQLGRVTTALYDNGTCVIYTYDAAGNRTAQTFTTSGTPTSPVWGSGVWGCFPWTATSK